MIWKQNEIRLICDGVEYGKIAMNLKESATKLNVAEAANWNSANFLAPFDKEVGRHNFLFLVCAVDKSLI